MSQYLATLMIPQSNTSFEQLLMLDNSLPFQSPLVFPKPLKAMYQLETYSDKFLISNTVTTSGELWDNSTVVAVRMMYYCS